MRCLKCNQPRTEDAVCPCCQPATASVDPMLARANLLRIRGNWQDAAETCAAVLRLDPHSTTAHSLLGDIYQDQGRLQDAHHWYGLAAELNPESQADRAKVARVEEMLEARGRRDEWEAVIEGRSRTPATTLLVRESIQRVAALAGAALCGILLVMASLVSLADRAEVNADEPPAVVSQRRQAPEIVIETRRERDLLTRVSELTPGAAGRAVRVELDPRLRAAHLRVYLPRRVRERLATPEYRSVVLREGYRSAHALHRAERSLTVVHVYVVAQTAYPHGAPETDLLLVGSLGAENLVVDPEAVTVEELQKFYAELGPPAWTPDLAL
jgi:hypothetical protein